jgi:plasmid stabilization system protein ParE
MAEVVWRESGLDDLRDIVEFLDRTSPSYAERIRSQVFAATRRLETLPLMGRVVPEFGEPHVREVIVRPYRVVYVVRGETCFIVAVVHGSRDFRTAVPPEDLDNGP